MRFTIPISSKSRDPNSPTNKLIALQKRVQVKPDSDIIEYTVLSLVGVEPRFDRKYHIGVYQNLDNGRVIIHLQLPCIPNHFNDFFEKMKQLHPDSHIQMLPGNQQDEKDRMLFFKVLTIDLEYFFNTLYPLLEQNIATVAEKYDILEATPAEPRVTSTLDVVFVGLEDPKKYWYPDEVMRELMKQGWQSPMFKGEKGVSLYAGIVTADFSTSVSSTAVKEMFAGTAESIIETLWENEGAVELVKQQGMTICFFHNATEAHWVPCQIIITPREDGLGHEYRLISHNPLQISTHIMGSLKDVLTDGITAMCDALGVSDMRFSQDIEAYKLPARQSDNFTCGPDGVYTLLQLLFWKQPQALQHSDWIDLYECHQLQLEVAGLTIEIPPQYRRKCAESLSLTAAVDGSGLFPTGESKASAAAVQDTRESLLQQATAAGIEDAANYMTQDLEELLQAVRISNNLS